MCYTITNANDSTSSKCDNIFLIFRYRLYFHLLLLLFFVRVRSSFLPYFVTIEIDQK